MCSTTYRYKSVKTIDTKAYLDSLCSIAATGSTVSTIVTGGSMIPFLGSNRDYVFLQAPQKALKKGDIVLFQRSNGDYVLHRIKSIKKDGCYLLGDRQYSVEGPISLGQIRCVAVSVKRKGKILTPRNLLWKFYSKIWVNTVFLRPLIFKIRSVFPKKTTHQTPRKERL